MFPRDAITIFFATKTAGTYTILPATTTPYTFLYGLITDSSGLDNSIAVNGNVLLKQISGTLQTELHYAYTNKTIQAIKSGTATTTFMVVYVPRNRNVTPDPALEATSTSIISGNVSVSNFPATFNIGNLATSTSINNFPSVQNVNCTLGCNGTSTSMATTTIVFPPIDTPTFNEWMFIVGVFLSINAIQLWSFIFKKPQKMK